MKRFSLFYHLFQFHYHLQVGFRIFSYAYLCKKHLIFFLIIVYDMDRSLGTFVRDVTIITYDKSTVFKKWKPASWYTLELALKFLKFYVFLQIFFKFYRFCRVKITSIYWPCHIVPYHSSVQKTVRRKIVQFLRHS